MADEGCDFCRDDDGTRILPQYGVAPHECYWRKGPEFKIGQSTLLPVEQWRDAFVPDLEPDEDWAAFVYPQACGVYYCPRCDAQEYEAAWSRLVARIGEPPSDSDTHPEGGDADAAPFMGSAGLEEASPTPGIHQEHA